MSLIDQYKNSDPEKLRREVEARLQWGYAHGHIGMEELEERLKTLNESPDKITLLSLAEDIPGPGEGTSPDEMSAPEDPGPDSERESPRSRKGNFFSLLGSQEQRGPWDVPSKIDVAAILGSQVLDFREARFPGGTVRIEAFSLMGSIDLILPPECRISSRGVPILGSIENRTRSSGNDGPVLELEGFALMGSIRALNRD